MNAVLLEQTTVQLTRQTSRWDRRLRLATSLIWVPRGLMVGLIAGIVVALISRLRPWLLPEQIAVIAGVALAISGIGALGLIWLWPRSKTQRARYFDQRFGLKERISTALELAGGLLPYSGRLAERQLTDAVGSAQGVNMAARLPLRVYWREIVAVIGLVLLLGYLLIEDNPMNQQLRSQRDWQNALDSQIANLDETIQRIEQNPALSAEQKDALTQPLQEARDILQQPDVTQEEAVAAMAEATQSLKDQTNGMSPGQQAAYQNAAGQLGRTGLTGDMADALQKPDLNAAAAAMDDMAQQLGNGELSQQQQQQVADQLDAAAQQMQQADPQTAQQLSQAADALRSGDQQAAQQAMEKAADSTREQQAQNQNSAAAQAAQNAAQQVQRSQQDLAQAGQQTTASPSGEPRPAPEGAQPPGNSGQQDQQSQQQQSQSDQGQQSQSQAGQPQSGSGQQDQTGTGQDQAGQPGEGQPQQADGNQTQQQGAGNGQSDQGEGQPGNQSASGSQQGEGEGTDGSPSAGDSTSGSQHEQGGSLSAGSGEGGAGMDTTTGTVVDANGQQVQANNGAQESSMQDYNPAYDSTTIGGPVDQTVDVGGQGTSQEGDVVQEGDFGPNPAGESTLSYTGVYSSYQGVVSDALESGRIPLDQRDVIHDYFSSLDR
jgi:uncharacterized membrane-anchored protein YhcB (DUF1043 family)